MLGLKILAARQHFGLFYCLDISRLTLDMLLGPDRCFLAIASAWRLRQPLDFVDRVVSIGTRQ